jgi:hypothetical protein
LKKVVIFQFASIDGIEYFFYYDGSDKLQLHPSFMFMKVLINVGWASEMAENWVGFQTKFQIEYLGILLIIIPCLKHVHQFSLD